MPLKCVTCDTNKQVSIRSGIIIVSFGKYFIFSFLSDETIIVRHFAEKAQNASGGINSALAKFPEFLMVLSPRD